MRLASGRITLNKFARIVSLLCAIVFSHRYIRTAFEKSPAGVQNNIEEHDYKFVWSNESHGWMIERGLETEARRVSRCIWPDECASDRIIDQLLLDTRSDRTFSIHIQKDYSLPEGPVVFLSDNCLVNKCKITYDLDAADAIVFQNADVFREPHKERRHQQVWIAYLLESPVNTFDTRLERRFRGKHVFNWTASYRTDSDLVTPYSKFVPFRHTANIKSPDQNVISRIIRRKRFQVAWLVSNCRSSNNRLDVAKELSRYIQVDIFGACGNMTCSKSNHSECLKRINEDYKFYLSFENSNCKEYITEKFYHNALGYNDHDHMIVPIVMGPDKQDYLRLGPPNSFIHIDDFSSLKDLADYLKQLDGNDSLYERYFHWKATGRFIDTKFLCRLCAMLHWSHANGKQKSYASVRDWWTKGSSGVQAQCA